MERVAEFPYAHMDRRPRKRPRVGWVAAQHSKIRSIVKLVKVGFFSFDIYRAVFEKLGPSLYDFLRKNAYRPFPIDLVREIGRQLLESVACV
ncbi:hypothetical protein B296_00055705 [Ensete ventricosum]|uniref:Uncharacterized protein n=1 Tax=Ensete ventricosum TaxID=4639 RepID=A0A426XGM4_ENSVE|nr:hypothetical protein B296_00055705 [Ensete ventricosum]